MSNKSIERGRQPGMTVAELIEDLRWCLPDTEVVLTGGHYPLRNVVLHDGRDKVVFETDDENQAPGFPAKV